MTRALLVLALLSGCGPLTPPTVDAGAGGGGGAATGGGTSTGGGSATGGGTATGGGAATGGGSSTGGGSATGGGSPLGIWEFSILSLQPAPANSGQIIGFAETDAGIFAAATNGRLYRSTGGAFLEVANLGTQLKDFEGAPTGELFALTTVEFFRCTNGDCADGGSWSNTRITPSNESMESLCVVDRDHVIAVGAQGSGDDGVMHKWNGITFAPNPTTLGYVRPRRCWKGTGGDFFIPVDENVLRYSPTGESFTPESTTMINTWRGGGSGAGRDFVCGSGPTIWEREPGPTWTPKFAVSSMGTLNVIAVISSTVAFGFGAGFTATGQAGYRFDGSNWVAMNPDLPGIYGAHAVFRASDGRLYIGGDDSNFLPLILRGTER